jgi:hypothetical protein
MIPLCFNFSEEHRSGFWPQSYDDMTDFHGNIFAALTTKNPVFAKTWFKASKGSNRHQLSKTPTKAGLPGDHMQVNLLSHSE